MLPTLHLRTLFLLTAAFATWFLVWQNHRQCEVLRTKIAVLRPLSHELEIHDPKRPAAVLEDPSWYEENRWSVYLPTPGYRLCVATREVDARGWVKPREECELPSGRFTIELTTPLLIDEQWNFEVRINDQPQLKLQETRDWTDQSGSVGAGQFSTSAHFSTNEPTTLFRRQFTRRGPQGGGSAMTPRGPTEGILVWIEPPRALSVPQGAQPAFP